MSEDSPRHTAVVWYFGQREDDQTIVHMLPEAVVGVGRLLQVDSTLVAMQALSLGGLVQVQPCGTGRGEVIAVLRRG